MHKSEIDIARPILQKHYKAVLSGRKITDDEIRAEIDNLRRRQNDVPFLCDLAPLASALEIAGVSIFS